jgi:hypothetical protein
MISVVHDEHVGNHYTSEAVMTSTPLTITPLTSGVLFMTASEV